MKSSKTIKIIVMLISICVIILNTNIKSYAKREALPDSTDASQEAKEEFDPTANPNAYTFSNADDESKLKEKVGVILGVINVIGVVASVITLMVVGINYMFGSIEEKAEYKKTAVIYCLGAALLFGGTTIPNILYNIGTGLFK